MRGAIEELAEKVADLDKLKVKPGEKYLTLCDDMSLPQKAIEYDPGQD